MGKVVSRSELILSRSAWKRDGKGVVCASGCFDLLHPGHIRLLEQARAFGDILVVAVESDASVRAAHASRGPAAKKILQPITPGAERAEILAALEAVDYVAEFDEPSPRALFAELAPDVVVAGAEPRSAPPEAEFAPRGSRLIRVALEPGYSTALVIERISQLRA